MRFHPRLSIFLLIVFLPLHLVVSEGWTQENPAPISYQGRLDQFGVSANGIFDFRAVLYDALEFGNQASPVLEFNDVQVAEGLVNLQLDFGADVFSGTELFLQLEVRNGQSTGFYTLLQPRQRIFTVPYAVNSDKLNGELYQSGTVGDCSVFGSAGASGIVVFPTSFSEEPKIFLTPDISVGLGGCTTARVASKSATQFRWDAFIENRLKPCDCLHWLAIGSP